MTFGSVTVVVTGADVFRTLRKLSRAGVTVSDLGAIEGLSVRFTVARLDLPRVRQVCNGDGCALEVLYSEGVFRVVKGILKRPVLLVGALLMIALTLFLPSRVLFVEVEGAQSLSSGRIIAEAEKCGVYFGARRGELRSEVVKNRLLQALPQLQWVGLNTYGCRAVIRVQERSAEERVEEQKGISSLVAVRDGVIREMTVLQGNPVCKVGQSVQQGQVIISGYTDLGICIRGTVAKGEIFGDTRRVLEVVTPAESLKKEVRQGDEKKYSVIFGKFRINFYKGSGISGGSCDKMYSYRYLTLPGGLRLPVVLVEERSVDYDLRTVTPEREEVAQRLSRCAQQYLKGQMIAGRIEDRYEIITTQEGVYHQLGHYACYEMLGRARLEEDLGVNEIG